MIQVDLSLRSCLASPEIVRGLCGRRRLRHNDEEECDEPQPADVERLIGAEHVRERSSMLRAVASLIKCDSMLGKMHGALAVTSGLYARAPGLQTVGDVETCDDWRRGSG